MKHQFSEVPKAEIQRSSFDRSHGHKTTFDAGFLIPILCDEALPGDTFNCQMTGLARLSTPIFPVMDNMRLETFFFAVPIRLLWDNWAKFNGEQLHPGDSIDYIIPTIPSGVAGGFAEGGLEDYFGMPTLIENLDVSVLHHRAYNLIYNTWFRDENLINSAHRLTDDGPDAVASYPIQRRGKRHDYFTSALPWPQKGDSVPLPLGDTAPVIGLGYGTGADVSALTNVDVTETDGTGGVTTKTYPFAGAVGTAPNLIIEVDSQTDSVPMIYADLASATAATINQIRQAFQIQKLLERDARGGTRYTEIIKAHFGVTSPDARLQRPEYLGGGSTVLKVNPIAQTTEAVGGGTPQGNLAAIGTATMSGHGFVKSFTEHCIILGLISARADLTYQQGLPRMFSRSTRYDFFWPALSNIGEQAILNKEIYTQGTGDDDLVFGYQERYAEYRYKQSQITGKFRSNATGTLDAWHLSQDFSALPGLDAAFIKDVPPVDRVIAVPSEPHFILDTYFQMRCARPMPLYGVPGMIDHF